MIGLAEAAAVLRIVWIETHRDELAPAVRVVVGHGSDTHTTHDTDRVAIEHRLPEPAMVRVVSAGCCCATVAVCRALVLCAP